MWSEFRKGLKKGIDQRMLKTDKNPIISKLYFFIKRRFSQK